MTLAKFAFAFLIGGQFFAAIYSISKRSSLYPDARPRKPQDAAQAPGVPAQDDFPLQERAKAA